MPGILDFLAAFGRSMLAENMPPPVKAAMAIAEYTFKARKELTWAQKWMKYGYIPLLPTLTTNIPSGTTYQERADTPALFFMILFFSLIMTTMGMIFYSTQRARINAAVARETTHALACALAFAEPIVKIAKPKFSAVGNILLKPLRILVFPLVKAIHMIQWIYRVICSVKRHIVMIYDESVLNLMLRNQERRERIRQLEESAVKKADLVKTLQRALPDIFHGSHNQARENIWALHDFLQLLGTLDLEKASDILIRLITARDILDEIKKTLPHMFKRDDCVNLRAKELKKFLECLGTNDFREGTKRIKQLQADQVALKKLREERPTAFTFGLGQLRSETRDSVDQPPGPVSSFRLEEMLSKSTDTTDLPQSRVSTNTEMRSKSTDTTDLPKSDVSEVSTTSLEDMKPIMSDMVEQTDFQRGKFAPAFRGPEEEIRDQLDVLIAIYADMEVKRAQDALNALARLKDDHDMMTFLRENYPLQFDGDVDHVSFQLTSLFRQLDDAQDLRPCSNYNDSYEQQIGAFHAAKIASFLHALDADQASQLWTQEDEQHLFQLVAGASYCEVEHKNESGERILRYSFGHCRHFKAKANVVVLPPATGLDFASLASKTKQQRQQQQQQQQQKSPAKPTGHKKSPPNSGAKAEGSSGGHVFPKSDQEEDEQLQEALKRSRDMR